MTAKKSLPSTQMFSAFALLGILVMCICSFFLIISVYGASDFHDDYSPSFMAACYKKREPTKKRGAFNVVHSYVGRKLKGGTLRWKPAAMVSKRFVAVAS